jgi:cytoskeletal protein RodZ
LDIFQKYVGHHKAGVATINVVVDEWFYYKDASHIKNKRIYTRRGNKSILNLVQFDTPASY